MEKLIKKLLINMFARLILDILGYKIDPSFKEFFKKQRIGIFPHTSRCEVVIMSLALMSLGLEKNLCFPVAYEYIENPLFGWWLRYFGGFPVYKGMKNTETSSKYLIENRDKCFLISPEGSLAPGEWKKGFYYIAMTTGSPIVICGIDFSTHTIKYLPEEYYISVDDDPEIVIPKLKNAFAFSGITPLYPEKSNPRIINSDKTKSTVLPLRGKLVVTFLLTSIIGITVFNLLI